MAPNDRRCVSCRRVAPKSTLLRVVRIHPTHTVELDQGMGRSAYLCPTVACLEAAQRRDRLSRMLKVKVPVSIYEALWQRVRSSSSGSGTSESATIRPASNPETAPPRLDYME